MKTSTLGIIGTAALGILTACGETRVAPQDTLDAAVGDTTVAPRDTLDAAVDLEEPGGAGVDGNGSLPLAITSAEAALWQMTPLSAAAGVAADLTVDDAAEAQTWEGFAGCFTERGWTHLSTLSQSDRDVAMQLLFGADGARFAWGRIPIGGNDYVASRHTLDDTGDDVVPDPAESNRPAPDLALSRFSIEGDKQNLIPYIKAAQAAKPDLRFWAVPWSPPVWMKTGYSTRDSRGAPAKRPSYYDGGSMKDDSATLQANAQYFTKLIQAYESQGIHIEMVAPQNEPAGGHTYPSCRWSTGSYTRFIGQYLGPALDAAGLATKIMIGGSLDAGGDTAYLNAVLADPTAAGYCPVVGVGYDMVDATKVSAAKSAGLRVWVSEHRAGNYPWETATYQPIAPNDMAYAVETWGLIRTAITKVGVTSYAAWHMVLDSAGLNIDTSVPWAQNTLLVADAGQLTITPAYYVFRHFSQFVDPGAKVVGTRGGDAVAFKNPDGGLVVVFYNSGATKTMAVAIGGKLLQLAVPGRGFATVVKPQ